MIQFRWRRHLLIFEKVISKEKNPNNIIFKEEPSSQKSFDPDNLTKKSILDIFVKLKLERVRYLVSSSFFENQVSNPGLQITRRECNLTAEIRSLKKTHIRAVLANKEKSYDISK